MRLNLGKWSKRTLVKGLLVVCLGIYLWTLNTAFTVFKSKNNSVFQSLGLEGDVVHHGHDTLASHRQIIESQNVVMDLKEHQEFCPNFQSFRNNHQALMVDVVLDKRFAGGLEVKGGDRPEDVMHRPETAEYYTFKKGFFKIVCPGLEKYKTIPWNNHLQDWFQAVQGFASDRELELSLGGGTYQNLQVQDTFTIAVTRYEYANLYHTMTDWYNAFQIMKTFHKQSSEIQILIIDGHAKAQLESTWKTLFKKVHYLGHETWDQTKYSKFAWNEVGYLSVLNDLVSFGRKPKPPDLDEFSKFFLDAYGLASSERKLTATNLNISFLSRRDYLIHPRQQESFKKGATTIERKIENEDELQVELKAAFPALGVQFFQPDKLSMDEQLKIVVNTDILISMHGAGLTHQLFMPKSSGVIELFPRYISYRPHFQNLARWRQQAYIKWTNRDSANEHDNYFTRIPPDVLIGLVRDMIQQLLKRQKS